MVPERMTMKSEYQAGGELGHSAETEFEELALAVSRDSDGGLLASNSGSVALRS